MFYKKQYIYLAYVLLMLEAESEKDGQIQSSKNKSQSYWNKQINQP
jgi:hypothetical protein